MSYHDEEDFSSWMLFFEVAFRSLFLLGVFAGAMLFRDELHWGSQQSAVGPTRIPPALPTDTMQSSTASFQPERSA